LIGLTLAGYLLTVATLLGRTINTVIVVGGVWLGYSLATRALVLSETRLVMRRMREQRAKAAAMEGSTNVGEGRGHRSAGAPPERENINQQTRTLLRVTAGAALVLGTVVGMGRDPAGADVAGRRHALVADHRHRRYRDPEPREPAGLFAGDLPGRAVHPGGPQPARPGGDPALTQHQMDAAGRYTVTTLLRYVLAVVAVISVFSLLGLRWSELQWMVAALTLGLGFGLQEVVANFVSGIIMLFERPVRVGDTITIGEYSGTVARIRTRATTIVDWDNREIVVPNKNFITERLINWTLSDTMTRIVIPVGVSYDADVDEVMSTLRQHRRGQPAGAEGAAAPRAVPELRRQCAELRTAGLRQPDEGPPVTISELHQAIIKEFRNKGIEIAYPQMDLHIRDVAPRRRAEPARREVPPEPGEPRPET
jgi:potassium-dependent mechanosensitive channel